MFLAFCSSAREIMLTFTGHNSCIASTRITIETLRRFGINCTPMPVKFALEVEAHNVAYSSGLTQEELATANKSVETPWETGWRGHLVASYKDALIDPSLDQADIALKGILGLRPEVYLFLFSPDHAGLELEFSTPKQKHCKLTYIQTGDNSYQESEAWNDEALPLLSDLIFRVVDRKLRKIQRNEL